jgi:hypothetical protein
MTMKKTLCTLALAGCAVALAPAGATAAKPAKPKAAKFLVQVVGTQTTTYTEPRRNLYSNCLGQRWTEASAQETVEFRTKQSKVLITDTGRVPKVKLNTWNPRAQGDYYLAGRGTVDRTGEKIFGLDPDPRCADGDEVTREDTGPYDCRSIPVDYHVRIDWAVTLAAVANPRIGTLPQYKNCPISAPHPVIPTKFTIVRSEPFHAKELFAKKAKYHEVLGQADYRVDDMIATREAKVRWVIRFKRVK